MLGATKENGSFPSNELALWVERVHWENDEILLSRSKIIGNAL